MLITISVFPPETQSLAGGVFNTVSQIGNAIGLAAGGVIAASVTAGSNQAPEAALLRGYRATFWAGFAACAVVGFVSMMGLRKAGRVGLKVD
jgi:MFS family permease